MEKKLAPLVTLVLLSVTCSSSQPVTSPAPAPAPVPTSEVPSPFPSSPTPSDHVSLVPAPLSEPASPPSQPSAPSLSPSAGSPGQAMGINRSKTSPDSDSGGLKTGQKAGIAVGVVVGAGLVGMAGFVYKKRKDNIRRARYGYAARGELL